MHVRKIYWTEDGRPIVSPQRYAAVEQSPVTQDELIGEWEQIVLGYQVVPGMLLSKFRRTFRPRYPSGSMKVEALVARPKTSGRMKLYGWC